MIYEGEHYLDPPKGVFRPEEIPQDCFLPGDFAALRRYHYWLNKGLQEVIEIEDSDKFKLTYYEPGDRGILDEEIKNPATPIFSLFYQLPLAFKFGVGGRNYVFDHDTLYTRAAIARNMSMLCQEINHHALHPDEIEISRGKASHTTLDFRNPSKDGWYNIAVSRSSTEKSQTDRVLLIYSDRISHADWEDPKTYLKSVFGVKHRCYGDNQACLSVTFSTNAENWRGHRLNQEPQQGWTSLVRSVCPDGGDRWRKILIAAGNGEEVGKIYDAFLQTLSLDSLIENAASSLQHSTFK